jgi:hypothetical protein
MQILHCHVKMFEPNYIQYLIIYVNGDLLFFDLGYCAGICSLHFARVSLMVLRKVGLEAANIAFCDTAVGNQFCVEVKNVQGLNNVTCEH